MTKSISAPVGLGLAGAAVCAALPLFLVLSGCSSSTEPPPPVKEPEVTFSHTPFAQGPSLRLSETMDFSVSSNRPDDLLVNWYRGGSVVGQDSVFTFIPAAVGTEFLEVSAFVGAVRDTYFWKITVTEDVSVIPPEVTNVEVFAGPEPADVTVEWLRVSESTFPLVEYLVAMSYDGEITEANWDQATILDRLVPIPSQIRYTRNFTESLNGTVPGATAWFAVRVVDDRQQLSPLKDSFVHDITWPWWLGGKVFDESGRPLLGVILESSEGGYSSNSDADGVYLFDLPFRNIDLIRIGTNSSSWYDFLAPAVSVDQDTTYKDITLITKHGIDATCNGGDFLEYLREITWTSYDSKEGVDWSKLWKWEEFPVTVYIPPGLNDVNVNMETACLAAMDRWNRAMADDALSLGVVETDYFVRITDEVNADVVFIYEAMIVKYGEVSLALPDGLDDHLGKVIPEQLNVKITNDSRLANASLIQDVALHELGHVLGFRLHPGCTNDDYLMTLDGALGSTGRPEPIHLDERRAVRTIRNLPQGVQMLDFTGAKIEFE